LRTGLKARLLGGKLFWGLLSIFKGFLFVLGMEREVLVFPSRCQECGGVFDLKFSGRQDEEEVTDGNYRELTICWDCK
jgi:thiamine transporter ThiT